MADGPQTPSVEGPRDPKTGQIKPGHTLNPGGEPRWLRSVRAELEAGSVEAARYLVRVAKGEEKFVSVYGKNCTEIELPVLPKDRIAASKVVLEYVVPKPKEKAADADRGKKALPDLPKAIVDELARLDS